MRTHWCPVTSLHQPQAAGLCQVLGERLGAGPEPPRQAGIPTPPSPSFSAAHIKAEPLTLPANPNLAGQSGSGQEKGWADRGYLLSSAQGLWYSDCGGWQSQRGHCSLKPGLPQGGREVATHSLNSGWLRAWHRPPQFITLPEWFDSLH